MKNAVMNTIVLLLATFGNVVMAADTAALEAKNAQLQAQVDAYETERAQTTKNLERFRQLDLVAFNNRNWDLIKDIHHEDVVAQGADGVVSNGMVPAHEWDLKFLFETFPDFTIHEHLITFGYGGWTAGLSRSTGTFTQPMKLRDGTVIEPTGKMFEFTAITLARWEDGRIMEEYIYWDNNHLFNQLGINQ